MSDLQVTIGGVTQLKLPPQPTGPLSALATDEELDRLLTRLTSGGEVSERRSYHGTRWPDGATTLRTMTKVQIR